MEMESVTVAITDDDGWHPLSGVPAPEYVPETWSPEFVAGRLIEAYRAIARSPRGQWVRGFAEQSLWPEMIPTVWDLYWQGTPVPRSHRRPGRLRGRPVRATSDQIARAERALDWVLWLWRRDEFAAMAVIEFATFKGEPWRDKDESWEELYEDQPERAWHIAQALLERGLRMIALHLNRIGHPVS